MAIQNTGQYSIGSVENALELLEAFVKRKTSYASRTWRSDWDSPNRAFLGFFDQVEPDPSLETVTREPMS